MARSSAVVRIVAIVTVTIGTAGCHGDSASWRRTLAAPAVQHLAGSWEITVRRFGGSDTTHWRRVTGHLALTLNDQGLDLDDLGSRPMVFGTYDVAFDSVGVRPGTSAGVPAVAAVLRGDSLHLVVGPGTGESLELGGVLHGDSAAGLWRTFQRAGPGAIGDFTLRRQ